MKCAVICERIPSGHLLSRVSFVHGVKTGQTFEVKDHLAKGLETE